jgi:hypothetical protein
MSPTNAHFSSKRTLPRTIPLVVSFDLDHVVIYPVVERREDMSPLEASYRWFSKHELQAIESSNQDTLARIGIGTTEPPHMCYRGLEYPSNTRPKNIHRAWQAAFQEQRRQRQHGISDPELLAIVYQGYSIPCLQKALRNAQLDVRNAAAFDEETGHVWMIQVVNNDSDEDNNFSDISEDDYDLSPSQQHRRRISTKSNGTSIRSRLKNIMTRKGNLVRSSRQARSQW